MCGSLETSPFEAEEKVGPHPSPAEVPALAWERMGGRLVRRTRSTEPAPTSEAERYHRQRRHSDPGIRGMRINNNLEDELGPAGAAVVEEVLEEVIDNPVERTCVRMCIETVYHLVCCIACRNTDPEREAED